MKKLFLGIALVSLAFACGTTKEKTGSTQVVKKDYTPEEIVASMSSKYQGYTVSNFAEGKNLYEMHCGKCHDLAKPTDYSEERWTKIVPGMTKAVNKNGVLINEQQQELVLRYLVSVTTLQKSEK